MEEIQMIATFPSISAEDLEEFEKCADEALRLVRTEGGNLQYDWFLSDDKTRCVVQERYVDSDAVLEHLGNVGGVLPRLAELGGGLEVDVLGDPTRAVRDAVSQRVRAFHPRFAGK